MKVYLSLIVLALTWSQLAFTQELSPHQLEFLKHNTSWINAGDFATAGRWNAIDDFVMNKDIVLLGEFNHETPEVFEIKNDLIKYLHEQHGFNTILFEAGIGELIVANQQKESLTPAEMTYGFFSYWRSKELQDLMQYIRQEGMEMAGFDVQRFGRSFANILTQESKTLSIDTSIYQSIEKRFGAVQDILTDRRSTYDASKDKTNQLITDYDRLLTFFREATTENGLFIKRTIENRIHYLKFRLQFLKDQNWNQRWIERDSMMAENINWLLDNFYKDEKVIIYAHNFHIAKYNEKEEVMGEYLAAKMDSLMYSIGFFAGSGTYRKDKVLSSPDTSQLDIKHIIQELEKGVNFLHIPPTSAKGAEWLYQPLIVNDTFIDLSSSNTMILSKQFDGLILLDQIGPKK